MVASLFQNPTPPSSRPVSRQRHHDRRPSDPNRRYEREKRRLQSERHGEQQGRISPSRHSQRCWQQPTPPTTPGSSSISLSTTVEEAPRSLPMERTSSGNSIIADQTYEPRHNYTLNTCSDSEAARSVKYSTKPPQSDEKYVRYFRKLVESHDDLDDDALDSILIGADTVFFHGALSGRVRWEWSHPSQSRYETELIGSTALRPASAPLGGYETLIVLSAPILLNNSGFDRRLLLSAFLHELVHCYLFIRCGFLARDQGGHTEGFHVIAGIIDEWVAGCGVLLQLCNMKANLNHFRVIDRPAAGIPWVGLGATAFFRDRGEGTGRQHRHEGCSQSPGPEFGGRMGIETGMSWQAREEGWR